MMSMYDNREYRVPKAAREMVKRKGKRKSERKKTTEYRCIKSKQVPREYPSEY